MCKTRALDSRHNFCHLKPQRVDRLAALCHRLLGRDQNFARQTTLPNAHAHLFKNPRTFPTFQILHTYHGLFMHAPEPIKYLQVSS